MAQVDNRVVILTFDNKDFEKNIQQSTQSLDKLKNGMNFKESAKSLDAVSKSSKKFSLSGITDALDTCSYRFSTLGVVGATVISELTKTAMGVGHKIINAVAGPLTAGGWKRALNIEQAKFQLEGLGVAWNSVKDDIDYGVKDTAYGLDVAAKAASQLSASGVQLGTDMKAALRGISGVAAMSGSTYEEISQIFTRVAGANRVFATDLNSIAARGLNAAATLGKALGKTEAEIREMVRAGEIDFQTFANAMDNAFGEHAKEANKTFSGAMANVKAALSRIGADVAATQLTNFRDIFNSLIPLIDNIRKLLGPVIEKFNEFSKKATAGLVGFINKLNAGTPQARQNIKEVQGAISELSKSGFRDFDKLAEGFGVTTTELKDMVDGGRVTLKKFVSVMDTVFGDQVPGILDNFRESTEETNEALNNTGEQATKTAAEIEDAARKVLAGDFGTGDERKQKLEELGFSYEEVLNKVNDLAAGMFDYGDALDDASLSAEKNNELTEEQKKNLAELGAQVKKTATPMENIKAIIKNIGTALANVGRAIKEAFKEVFSGAFSSDIKRITSSARGLTEQLKTTEDGANGLKVVFKGLFTVVKVIIKAIGFMVTGFIKFITVIAAVIKKIVEFGGKLAKSFEESGRKAKLMEALRAVVTKVGDAIIAFKDKLVELGRAIKNSEGFKKLTAALQLLWGVVKDFFGKVFDAFVKKFKEFGSMKPNFSWIDKLAGFLSKVMGAIADFIVAMINGEHPIRKFFGSFNDADKPLGKFKNFLVKIKEAIVNFFKKGIPAGIEKGGSLLDSIKKFLVGSFTKLKEADIIGNIVEVFKKIGEKLKQVDWKTVAKQAFEIAKVVLAFRYVKSLIKFNESFGFKFNFNLGEFGKQLAKRDFSQKLRDIGIGLALISATLLILSKIPTADAWKAVGILAAILGALVGVFALVTLLGKADQGKAFMKFSASMTLLGIGLMVLAGAMKIMSMMKPETLLKGGGAIVTLVTLLAVAARIAGKSSFGTFTGMALAVAVLVPGLLILGKAKWETIKKGAKAIGIILAELAIASRLAGRTSFGTLIGMALAVGVIVPALFILGKAKWETIKQGAIAIGIILAELTLASRLAGKGGGLKNLVVMAGSVAAVTVALMVLGNMKTGPLLAATTALGTVLLSLSGAVKIASGIEKYGGVIAMITVLGAVSVALGILSNMNPLGVIASAAGIGVVSLSLAASLKILSTIKTTQVKTIYAMVGALSLMLAALALTFYALRNLNPESTLATAISLSAVILAFSAALALLASLRVGVGAAIEAALALDAFIVVVGALVVALGGLEELTKGKLGDLIEKGGGVLGKLGNALGNFMGSIQASYQERVAASMPGIADNLSKFAEKVQPFLSLNINEKTMEGVKKISEIISLMSGATFMDGISRLFSFGQDPYERVGKSLVVFGGYINSFARILLAGSINNQALQAAIMSADMVANFYAKVKGVVGGGLSSLWEGNPLAKFAQELLNFAPNFLAYVTMVKMTGITSADVEPSTAAAEVLVAFYGKVAAVCKGGVSSLWEGNPLTKFAKELLNFAPSFFAYVALVKASGITKADVNPSTAAAEVLVAFYEKVKNVVTGGIKGLWEGSPLKKFAGELLAFAPSLVAYVTIMRGAKITDADVESSISAGGLLVEFYNKVKGVVTGGIKGLWEGSPLAKFARELLAFAPSLTAYVLIMREAKITDSDVTASISAGELLVDFYNKVKGVVTGGLKGFFEGSPLKKFAQELAWFAPSIAAYIESVRKSKVNKQIAETSLEVASMVSGFYSQLKGVMGGAFAQLFSGNPLKKFGKELESFGPHLKKYSDSLVGVQPVMMKQATEAAALMAASLIILNSTPVDKLGSFGEKLASFGSNLKRYYLSVTGIQKNKVKEVVDSVNLLIGMAKNMSGVNTSVVSGFGSALEKCAKDGVDKFIKAFSNKEEAAKQAVTNFINKAKDGANVDLKGSLENVAKNAVAGFIYGIQDEKSMQRVYNAAWNMGRKVYEGARRALLEKSPSRLMREVGEYAGEGLAIGVTDFIPAVYSVGQDMGTSLLEAVAQPLKNIQSVIEDNIDINPVITPVVDFNMLNSDMNAINGMFGSSGIHAYGYSNLASYTNAANIQNLAHDMRTSSSSNSDIVTAIQSMKDDIFSLGERISQMQVRLDGKKLVGEIIDPLDAALGVKKEMLERRVY